MKGACTLGTVAKYSTPASWKGLGGIEVLLIRLTEDVVRLRAIEIPVKEQAGGIHNVVSYFEGRQKV